MLQQLISAIEGTTKHLISCQIQATSIVGKNATISEQACTVCLESKSLQDFDKYGIGNCTHPNRTICDNCMYEHVRHTWNVNSDIYCPECSVPLSHTTTKQILFNHGDSLLYERYAKFDLDRCLEENPEFVWCAHGCGSGQLSEGATMNKTVECVNCHKLTCFIHKCPWHDGMTCEEYEMPRTDGQTHASQRWINIHTKECCKCHSHIEKNDGCDHMTCLKCKYEFCWECLAPYSGIKRHGAYLHRRTCKHYPATDTRNILKRLIDLF